MGNTIGSWDSDHSDNCVYVYFRCCCGRVKVTEPDTPYEVIIINDIKHEESGPKDNFCGPSLHHDLRDLKIKVKNLEDAGLILADAVSDKLKAEARVKVLEKAVGEDYHELKSTSSGYDSWDSHEPDECDTCIMQKEVLKK